MRVQLPRDPRFGGHGALIVKKYLRGHATYQALRSSIWESSNGKTGAFEALNRSSSLLSQAESFGVYAVGYTQPMDKKLPDGMVEIELDLDDETMDLLEAMAAGQNKTVDEIVNDALRVAVAQAEARAEAEAEVSP